MECRTCKWWTNLGGYCKRRAPHAYIVDSKVLGDGGIRNIVWPRTRVDDWCGDHKEREVYNEVAK